MKQVSQPRRRKVPISAATIAGLSALLLLPNVAILRLAQFFDVRLIAGYLTLISLLTYLVYRHDKKRAEAGGWRTPESTLHMLELLGDWPAAFLAQRTFRHKTSKTAYQVTFWIIILFHEFVSFDFLQDWKSSKAVLSLFTDAH